MAEFLSEAWIEELGHAGVVVDDGPAFTFDQVVTGAPGGDVRYRVSVDGGRLRVRTLAGAGADGADATLTALAQGLAAVRARTTFPAASSFPAAPSDGAV